MPKTPIDYSKSVIYTISKNDMVYVGSTTDYVNRKSSHKRRCNDEKYYNTKLYKMIRENGGWTEFQMKPYKEYSCENSIQLCIEEENCRLLINSNLNSQRCHITKAEAKEEKKERGIIYRQEHKEEIKEKKKEFYESNKEQINEKKKEFYESNKEQFKEQNKKYRQTNKEQIKEQQKEYYEANRESIREKKNIFRQVNRETIREKANEIITCECGCISNKNNLARHKKSAKHINFIEK